jgi:hypothetical protein
MSDWSKPGLTDSYANVLTYIGNRLNSVVQMMRSDQVADSNIPANSIRWNSTNNYWEQYVSGAWAILTATYGISISGVAASATAVAWSGITGKPTTVAGYGISDQIDYLNVAQTVTAQKTFSGNQGTVIGTASTGLGAFWVYGDGTNAAYMTFHRPGAYAEYFGLDTDNQLKRGGWSAGANSYVMLDSGNYTTYAPSLIGSGASGTWGINVTGTANGLSGASPNLGTNWQIDANGQLKNNGNTQYLGSIYNSAAQSSGTVINFNTIKAQQGSNLAASSGTITFTNAGLFEVEVSIYFLCSSLGTYNLYFGGTASSIYGPDSAHPMPYYSGGNFTAMLKALVAASAGQTINVTSGTTMGAGFSIHDAGAAQMTIRQVG